jgi:hypothetical protein
MSDSDFLSNLRKTAWRTMGARFNASRRLKRRDSIGVFSVAVFALIGVGLAIIQRIYEFKAETELDNFVTALSVALGLFVVVISLIEAGNGAAVKSEMLYRNAEELSEFQRKLEQVCATSTQGDQRISDASLSEFRDEYERIKKRCPYNHEPVDDRAFRAEHREDFANANGKSDRLVLCLWHRARYRLNSALYFGVLWLIVLGLLAATPWSEISPQGHIRGQSQDHMQAG